MAFLVNVARLSMYGCLSLYCVPGSANVASLGYLENIVKQDHFPFPSPSILLGFHVP